MNNFFRAALFSAFSFCVYFAIWWRTNYIKCVWNNFKNGRVHERMTTANQILQTLSPYDPDLNIILVANTTQMYSWFQCRSEFYWTKKERKFKGDCDIFGNLLVQLIQAGLLVFLNQALIILPPSLARY